MSIRRPGSREEDAWLSDEQLAQCAPADQADTLRSPVPTQVVSNGEYMPPPQSEQQKRVEARIEELSAAASKKLGVSRRRFLASSGGMAAAFLAMNEVFGRFFDVSPIEMFEQEAFAASGAPSNLFVFDDQLHVVRGSQDQSRSLRAIAQGPGPASTAGGFLANPFNPAGLPDEFGDPWGVWNPALGQIPNTGDAFHLVQFIKDLYFDSQVTIGLLSNVTASIFAEPGQGPRPPKSVDEAIQAETLTAQQTAAVRNFVNQIAGSARLLAHGLLYTGVGNLDYLQYQIDNYGPDSWKGYTISNAAKVDNDPNSLMRQWRLDDPAVAYPSYELITRNAGQLEMHPGFFNICIHKGLSTVDTPETGAPDDVAPAARDWPRLNFIIYHSAIRPRFFMYDSLQEARSSTWVDGVPDIRWVTRFAQQCQGLPNVYGEIGTTFASTVVTFPTVTAHVLGQLVKYLGEDHVVFGSDSVWYGSPQWQIEALYRFQIPEELQRRHGYRPLTPAVKRKILGLNSARLYKVPGASEASAHGRYRPVPADYVSRIPDSLKTIMEFPGYTSDNFSRMRAQYAEMNMLPDHTRYGWIRKTA